MPSANDKSNDTPPVLSVVIPTRHRNDLLSLCLDRLAPGIQSLGADKYEVIVTDDGSADTAEEMIRAKYPWARWVAGPRMGPGANRNHGVEFARGEYVAFIDDDCLPSAGWLKAFWDSISDSVMFYEGRTTCEFGLRSAMDEAPINLDGNRFWSCNLMVNRSAFLAIGGYDQDFQFWCEDVDFRTRLSHSGFASMFVPAATIDHPPRKRKLGESAISVWKAHIQVWVKHGDPVPSPISYAVLVAKTRISNLMKYRWNRDGWLALGATLYESLIVLLNTKGWTQQFRRQYNHATPNAELQKS